MSPSVRRAAPNLSPLYGEYRNHLRTGACLGSAQSFSELTRSFTPKQIEYFRRHGIDMNRYGKYGIDFRFAVLENGQEVRAAFEKYASDCKTAGTPPMTGNRPAAHITRLISSKIETLKEFGAAMLRNKHKIESQLLDQFAYMAARSDNTVSAKKREKLLSRYRYGREAIQGEGSGTVLFWTFAPYLYRALVEKYKMSEEDAIMKVASWPFMPERGEGVFKDYYEIADNRLLGLIALRPYYLDECEAHPSHEFTRIAAEQVADYIHDRTI